VIKSRTTHCNPPCRPRHWGYHASARDLCTRTGFFIGSRAGSPETAIIASILPADLVALRDPVHGDFLLDIPTILAHVALIHGNVTAEDLLAWKAALLEKLSSPTDFLKHAALFAERYQKLHLEEPIAPSALFGIFESTFWIGSTKRTQTGKSTRCLR
jgi:hypothetical protein